MDGSGTGNGTVTAYLNGQSFGSLANVGQLADHSDPIGLGDTNAVIESAGSCPITAITTQVSIGAANNVDIHLGAYGIGHVRVFEWNGSAWVQKGVDLDGDETGDYAGWAVSMPDANTVAVGVPSNDGQSDDPGFVRVYSWNGSSWTQKGSDIDGGGIYDEYDEFG